MLFWLLICIHNLCTRSFQSIHAINTFSAPRPTTLFCEMHMKHLITCVCHCQVFKYVAWMLSWSASLKFMMLQEVCCGRWFYFYEERIYALTWSYYCKNNNKNIITRREEHQLVIFVDMTTEKINEEVNDEYDDCGSSVCDLQFQ